MNYYFQIADFSFKIESSFEWEINPFLQVFLTEQREDVKEVYQLVVCESLPEIKGRLVYQSDMQDIFSDGTREQRLMYLSFYHEPYILYSEEEINKIYIRKDFLSTVNRSDSFGVLNALALEKKMIQQDVIILHSSFIIVQNTAILFTAPSGTGKSTQADLWIKYENATLVNGDRTLIKKENGVWKGFGFPVCGSSKTCLNQSAPIKAIIYLSQAPQNKISRIKPSESIKKIISETSINFWNREAVNHAISLISDLCLEVPLYAYACTKEKDAVTDLKNFLENNVHE